ncbi:MAG TPA: hypothetical protein VLK33_02505 [Terriglobales bacterium]|nr:hypothetical protein [Terriglobales bacterium]
MVRVAPSDKAVFIGDVEGVASTICANGFHPKVVADLFGHTKVNLAIDVYDHTETEEFQAPLEK